MSHEYVASGLICSIGSYLSGVLNIQVEVCQFVSSSSTLGGKLALSKAGCVANAPLEGHWGRWATSATA